MTQIFAAHSADSTQVSRSQRATHRNEDAALVHRIANGDREAMRSLFQRHKLQVYRFLLRLVGNAALADDLTSEVFLDVWRQSGRFEGRSTVSTWMLAISRNKAIATFRRNRSEPLNETMGETIEDTAGGPELEMENRDRGRFLHGILRDLPVKHREIIDLVYYHEKSVREVSMILGIPSATVKTRLFYARKRIVKLLNDARVDGSLI
jgi:RNA polymerase sigma-70 factor, ECF subfamily